MSEPTPEPDPFPWLPLADVLDRLQLDGTSAHADSVDRARKAAAAYCERMRADLVVSTVDSDGDGVLDSVPVYQPTSAVVEAGHLIAGRLYARRNSPAGLASFAEFGPADILRFDPDAAMLLGIGRHATPKVG